MHEEGPLERDWTRRNVLRSLSAGLGSIALGSLLAPPARAAGGALGGRTHVAPRAKRVVYLTMLGGTSQTDLLDAKPLLSKHDGEPCPDELFVGKRLAFIRERPALLASPYRFERAGRAGVPVSELLPHFRGIVDDVTIIRSMRTDEFNHTPAELELLTGLGRFGRPSAGSWVSWGLGSENEDLPAFVALLSGLAQPAAGSALWGAGFLPGRHQGVQFRGVGEPVLFVENPQGVSRRQQREAIDAVNALNRIRLDRLHDPEIEARIDQYEMAFRMQMSVPQATDIWSEPPAVHEMYGTKRGAASFANQCLLARRLLERGVRFVQIFDVGWDHHTGIFTYLPMKCAATDRAAAALVRDLHQRGLLEDTLVVWASEFGRTPVGQVQSEAGLPAPVGRDHQRDAFTVWLAGGGVKKGFVHGRTDDFGNAVAESPVHVHDLNATMLHLLGIDHERLTYRHQGRDFRLTDVHGEVVRAILA
ncbi:MAG: DUF1501 domain-containing protein [Deltaproteobacteria bacterium]|nr:DUF1501 domain-containing protein [Deltaproteobacteria bacterium]